MTDNRNPNEHQQTVYDDAADNAGFIVIFFLLVLVFTFLAVHFYYSVEFCTSVYPISELDNCLFWENTLYGGLMNR